ncbi:C6 transcription factor [Fusarium acutatum]|uniref:C6 transcription factor n=1 Tax=Fusarium acutatum TaxID=78861 RepID=A0A8H4JCV3_9HYPO|nr:C6 transcription factor [Fusarium acutatum]
MDNDNSTQPEQAAQGSDAGLACNCCRKRKLRCSRETPICEHCRRTGQDCVYETKRARPGMKVGAIENVHKRLESLRVNEASTTETSSQQEVVDGQSLLFSLAREICKLNNPALTASPNASIDSIHKRRRTEEHVGYRERSQYAVNQPGLPDVVILDQVIDAYFRQIHPWIPMIHEARFRKRLQNHGDDRCLFPVLQAMMLSASHRVPRRDIAEIAQSLIGDQEDARDWVVSKATKSLTVENLQALIIICFRDIGDGEECRAWSLIGALTRMVEYLQLTIESEEADRSSFCRPYTSLHPPQGWTEAEERRRVFWCVFNLDRFCSFTTAWNTSLTSDDVNRRLPCDGISWRKEETVSTPYFGIWDKSAARIGNPIAFLPSHSTTAPANVDEGGFTPSEATTSPGAAASSVDMSTVGAFAYCIEATESLSRVTSYFLQQKVNIKDHNDLGSWLTRFKELDVRLVHWKILLPKKWKVNIAQQSSRMDPNLTLAHVTHNASMILLHQPIAFPPLDWTFRTRLPSFCSLDTCQAAAIEIATITNHYLQTAEPTGLLSNQYSFCVYLAARVLFLLWRCHATDSLSSEFWVLIRNLETMAERWAGPHQLGPKENLASKYQAVLVDLHTRCAQDASFNINPSAYTTEVKHSRLVSEHLDTAPGLQAHQTVRNPAQANGGPSFSGTVLSAKACYPGATSGSANDQAGQRSGSVGSGDLSMVSQMLLDAEFIDMDRVISFDDGIFGTEHESGCF